MTTTTVPPRWFWLRSIRARPLTFWALAGLSAAAILAATLAPLLLANLHAVSLAQETRAALHTQTAIQGVADVEKGKLAAPEQGAAALVNVPGAQSLWLPARIDVESQDPVTWLPGKSRVVHQAALSVPATGCAGLRLVRGSCRLGAGDVLLAQSTARDTRLQPGDAIAVAPSGTSLRVAGLYDDTTAIGRFVSAPALAAGPHATVPPADLIVGPTVFTALGLKGDAYAVRQLKRPLRPDQLATVSTVLRESHDRSLDRRSGDVSAHFQTGIGSILQRDADTMSAAGTLVEVIALESVGVAWLGAGLVSQRASRERAAEIALARTRGFSRRTVLTTAFVEPLVAVLAGLVPGLLLSAGASVAVAPLLLHERVAVIPSGADLVGVVAAAALALVGALVVVVAAAWPNVHLPLMQAFRERSEPRELSRAAFAGQAVVILVTLGLIATLLTQGPLSGAETAVLAPTLIAVSIGLLALRLVVVAVRRSTRRTPRSLGGLIVARRLGRAPTALWGPVLLAVGVALILFSTDSASAVVRWQTERADASVGAATVLHVRVPRSVDFERAVRQADPQGHSAMAVQETTSGSGPARIVAVDTQRLAAVTSWSPAWAGLDFATIAQKLAPKPGPSVVVRGTRLTVDLASVRGAGSAGLVSSVVLEVVVATRDGWQTVVLGAPHDGSLTAAMNCADGCRVVDIGAVDNEASPLPFSFHTEISSLSTDSQSADTLKGDLRGSLWRNRIGDSTSTDLPTTARVHPSGAGLSVSFADAGGGDVASIAPRDAAEPLPVIATPSDDAVAFPGIADTFLGSGIDGSSRLIRVVGTSSILPRSGGTGVLVDLSEIDRISDPLASDAADEVWLAPGAHPEVIKRLRADGIEVTSTATSASARSGYLLEAPSLAIRADLAIALVGLLAALAALFAGRSLAASSRRSDLASLRAAGLRSYQLRRILLPEFFVPPAVGVVTGVIGGVLASVATVSHLPLLVDDGAAPPATPVVDPAALGVIAVAVLVMVGAAALWQTRCALRDEDVL